MNHESSRPNLIASNNNNKKESSFSKLVSSIRIELKRKSSGESVSSSGSRNKGSIRNLVANRKGNKKTRAKIEACVLRPNDSFPELGCVAFKYTGETIDKAMTEGIATNRPLMIVFQELPGCMSCLKFAQDVLSHPLIVEAASSLFVPVVVNNRATVPGDAKVLDFYREPRLNNPVVRFVSARTGSDIATRVADGNLTVAGLGNSMLEALPQRIRENNRYLDLLVKQELAWDRKKQATFSAPSFWAGETKFADTAGVIGTKAGWVGDQEVVQVSYDPNTISFSELVKTAIEDNNNIPISIFYENDAEQEAVQDIVLDQPQETRKAIHTKRLDQNEFLHMADGDAKHFLRTTTLRFVPLTALQSTKINRCIAQGRMDDVIELLSPTQLVLYRAFTDLWMNRCNSMTETVEVSIMEAWRMLK